LFGFSGEELGFDDDGDLRKLSFTEDLEVAESGDVNLNGLFFVSLGVLSVFVGDEGPDFVEVDRGSIMDVLLQVELSHTNLSEVSWMAVLLNDLLFIHHDSVVVLTSGVTSSSRMLSVLSDSTVSHTNVSSVLSGLS
jgi:hypothetical protein